MYEQTLFQGVILLEWVVNGFLKDKWVRYYSSPTNTMREFIKTLIFHGMFIILIWTILLYLISITTNAAYLLISLIVGILLTLHEVHTWIMMDYLKFSWQPIKIKFSDEGLEIINLFGKYKLLEWNDIKKIEYSEGKLLWEEYKMYEATIIPRPKPLPVIAPQKVVIGLDVNIGEKVLEYWKTLIKTGKWPEVKG